MDYRYETKKAIRDFHKQRLAFIIINDEVNYLEDSSISHWEYCQTLNITKEVFITLIRGFCRNDYIVFYKDNFIYDEELINNSLKYIPQIKKVYNKGKLKIYFGQIVSTEKDVIWQPDYLYGEIEDKIIKYNN
ncbi:MAG TPA: hypothetical protein PK737_01675 [Bacilli bacterium]|nr:hypothetical protein [Bacilli bacterium]